MSWAGRDGLAELGPRLSGAGERCQDDKGGASRGAFRAGVLGWPTVQEQRSSGFHNNPGPVRAVLKSWIASIAALALSSGLCRLRFMGPSNAPAATFNGLSRGGSGIQTQEVCYGGFHSKARRMVR